VPDAPVTGGEKQENIPSDDLSGGDEAEKKQNIPPALLGGAVIAVCGVGFFVFRKKKS
jgi:LPXTG-motif cell wall-anchored protein